MTKAGRQLRRIVTKRGIRWHDGRAFTKPARFDKYQDAGGRWRWAIGGKFAKALPAARRRRPLHTAKAETKSAGGRYSDKAFTGYRLAQAMAREASALSDGSWSAKRVPAEDDIPGHRRYEIAGHPGLVVEMLAQLFEEFADDARSSTDRLYFISVDWKAGVRTLVPAMPPAVMLSDAAGEVDAQAQKYLTEYEGPEDLDYEIHVVSRFWLTEITNKSIHD